MLYTYDMCVMLYKLWMYTNNLMVCTVHKTHIVTTKVIIAALTSQVHFLGLCALVSAAYVQHFPAPLTYNLSSGSLSSVYSRPPQFLLPLALT